MLTLNKTNRLVRFSYSDMDDWINQSMGSYQAVNDTTSICALFWRIVARAVAVLTVFFVLPIGALAGFIWCAIYHPMDLILTVTGLITLALMIKYYRRFSMEVEGLTDRMAESTVMEFVGSAFWGIKNRVCPIIKLVDVK